MRAFRRRLLAVVATWCMFVGLAPAVAAASEGTADVSVNRYGGADRYETSLLVAEAFARDAGGELDWAVMVSGLSWPEAVVAASVAGVLDAPVLMTPPDQLRPDAAEFLATTGVSSVLAIDTQGPDSDPDARISDSVTDVLTSLGISSERVSGADRYATGAAVARKLGRFLRSRPNEPGDVGIMSGLGRTAVVASGEVFADALVAGPFSARGSHPVLLTPRDRLHPEVVSYLSRASVDHVVLMGGTAALSAGVEDSLTGLGVTVTRLAGATRYDTAIKAAELVQGRYSDASTDDCFGRDQIGLARARVPFDSFSAGPLLARLCAPLVLTDPQTVPAETATFMDSARTTAGSDGIELTVFGGVAAVSDAALSEYLGTRITTVSVGDGDSSGSGSVDDGPASAALPAGSCGGKATDPPTQLLPDLSAFYPAWSPDCRHIAYSDGGAIWVAKIDGSEPQRLVGDAGGSSYGAAWSPDGTKIAYAFEQHGEGYWLASIWVINIDGSGKTQLTDGTFHDRGVSWSPDGSTIAFRRFYDDSAPGEHGDHGNYIMTMDASGKNLTQITARNSWGFSPVWSPDGSKIAYVSGGDIIEINPDGTDPRWIASGTDSSISWSPHGDRIAYIQHLDGTSVLKTVHTDGFSEEIVAEIPAEAHSAVWSPDGDRIAYYTFTGNHADYRLWITGSAGDAPAAADDCKPAGLGHVSAGFPVPEWSPSAVGTVRLAVLFVDFPNAQARHSTHAEVAESIPYTEEYLEDASGGKLDLRFSVLHEWLRAEQGFEAYLEGGWLGTNASQYSAELAEGKLDFSDIDAVMTIFPSDQFSIATATGNIDVGGRTVPTMRMNVLHRTETRQVTSNGWAAAHELLHIFGLADLYGDSHSERPERKDGTLLVASDFGIMGLSIYSYIAENDSTVRNRTRLPSDHYIIDHWLRFSEMLAWSRWQIGWLTKSQVSCIEVPDALVTVDPVALGGDGTLMAAVHVDNRRVIVVEVRRSVERDQWVPFAKEGVLVYTVDSGLHSLPLKVAGDEDRTIQRYPLLQTGDSLSVLDHRVAVLAEQDGSYTVRIHEEP